MKKALFCALVVLFVGTGVFAQTVLLDDVVFSGANWALQSDGRRMSPTIGHNETTITRVNFTTTVPNATLVIHLDVSSESGYDFAFVGRLNTAASRTAFLEQISGTSSRAITIHVPTAGNHFVEIGYTKDGSLSLGADRAWFTIPARPASTITNVAFSGASWALQSDGRRMSPTIGHNQTTVTRVNFTTTAPNATLVIHLDVSSESGYDFAFVGRLNTAASRTAFLEQISGTSSRTITIQVPTAGNHFVEIGYTKDGSISSGSDRAWFTLEYR